MANEQTDERVLEKIKALVSREHELRSATVLDVHATAQLESLGIELDQCWDLLRQRRALREFGKNPDEATVRPPTIVENYKQ